MFWLVVQKYFTFWVALSLIWTLVALVAAATLPLVEAGPIIASMLKWGGGVPLQAKEAGVHSHS